jgi:hypothetical protein
MAYKVFTNGSTLQASELNENLMQQAVSTFSNAAARTAAITSPVQGQLTYLLDVNRYESWSGSAWIQVITPGAWVAYTPTLTGFTLGNGTLIARFTRIGKTVHSVVEVILGSTSSVTGWLQVTVPLNVFSGSVPNMFVQFQEAGVATMPGFGLFLGTRTVGLLAIQTAGTYGTQAVPSATVPFTWGTGDKFTLAATYETSE